MEAVTGVDKDYRSDKMYEEGELLQQGIIKEEAHGEDEDSKSSGSSSSSDSDS